MFFFVRVFMVSLPGGLFVGRYTQGGKNGRRVTEEDRLSFSILRREKTRIPEQGQTQ